MFKYENLSWVKTKNGEYIGQIVGRHRTPNGSSYNVINYDIQRVSDRDLDNYVVLPCVKSDSFREAAYHRGMFENSEEG